MTENDLNQIKFIGWPCKDYRACRPLLLGSVEEMEDPRSLITPFLAQELYDYHSHRRPRGGEKLEKSLQLVHVNVIGF